MEALGAPDAGWLSLSGGGVFACISPWNFPLAIFTGQIGGGAGSRQCGAGEAGRADAADCRRRRAAAAPRGHSAGRPPPAAGRWRPRRRSSRRRPAHRRRRLHRLDRHRAGHQPGARRPPAGAPPHRRADRRDRRPERDDRRFLGTARAGDPRCDRLGLPAAPASAVRRCACCSCRKRWRRRSSTCWRAPWTSSGRRSGTAGDRRRPGDRRRGAGDAGGAHRAHARGGTAARPRAPRPRHGRRPVRRPDAGRDRLACRGCRGEVFGPVLHVIRWPADRLPPVLEAIEATGYGLTLGVQSRIDETQRFIFERTTAGNVYVNRNQIGAVVGVQPFGGGGLSGTGPKAGGPAYLHRLVAHRAAGKAASGAPAETVVIPQRQRPPGARRCCGAMVLDRAGMEAALAAAVEGGRRWRQMAPTDRAGLLEQAAERLAAEARPADAAAALRFAAAHLRACWTRPLSLPGVTGERNELSVRPLGVVACLDAGADGDSRGGDGRRRAGRRQRAC